MSTDKDTTIKYETKITIPINVEFFAEVKTDGSMTASCKIHEPPDLANRLLTDVKTLAQQKNISFVEAMEYLGFKKVESKLVLL